MLFLSTSKNHIYIFAGFRDLGNHFGGLSFRNAPLHRRKNIHSKFHFFRPAQWLGLCMDQCINTPGSLFKYRFEWLLGFGFINEWMK